MTIPKRNSSFASIRLTRRNFDDLPLLRQVNGKPTASLSPPPPPPPPHSKSNPAASLKASKSVDINAPPESSADEEDSELEVEHISITKSKQTKPDKQKVLPTSARGGNGRARRSRLKDEDDLTSLPPTPQNQPDKEDLLLDNWSQRTANKRRKIDFSQRSNNIHTSATSGFKPIPAPISPPKKSHLSGFSVPDAPSWSPRSSGAPQQKSFHVPPPLVSKPTNLTAPSSFNVPDEVPSGATSVSPSAANSQLNFSPLDSSLASTRPRSHSNSSLSSIDSIASLVLTQHEKAALLNPHQPLLDPSTTARCPMCAAPVPRLDLETFNHGARLTIRHQQRFCHLHKVREAEETAQRRGYPAINWAALESRRIPAHLAHAELVITGKRSSTFRTRLETAYAAADHSRKALQTYLKDGIIDNVQHGYYGPKGAQVIGHAITERLAGELRRLCERDPIARAAGVGGYVSAVLVPEVVERLVMEDMGLGIREEGEARRLVEESSAVGLLLSADEEVVMDWDEEDGG